MSNGDFSSDVHLSSLTFVCWSFAHFSIPCLDARHCLYRAVAWIRPGNGSKTEKENNRQTSCGKRHNVETLPEAMLALLILCSSLKLIDAQAKWNVYLNAGNRTTDIPGVLTPLLLVNLTDAGNLTSDDKLLVNNVFVAYRDSLSSSRSTATGTPSPSTQSTV